MTTETQIKLKPSRMFRAQAVRDRIVAWLADKGQIEVISGLRVQRETAGPYTILYRTPFSGLARMATGGSYDQAALWQANQNLQYGLDVWENFSADGQPRMRKLLNLEWNHDGHAELVSFKAGDWDAALLCALDEAEKRGAA
jgi:hypothetical protein